MADKKFTQLTKVTSLSDSDLIVVSINVGTAPVTRGIEKSNIIPAPSTSGNVLTSNGATWTSAAPTGGGNAWTAGTGTWSYSSADSPTFVISVNNDQTALIGVGMRIKLTQTTAKYFIVTAVGAYSGGATLITVYGGTDYTLANAAITNPYYSNIKAPFGFPMAKSKWTVAALSDSTNRSQASPTSGTIYNLGSLSLSVPIGEWDGEFKAVVDGARASAGGVSHQCTLSTANNTINTGIFIGCAATNTTEVLNSGCVSFRLAVASKTTYYVTSKCLDSGMSNIFLYNSSLAPLTVNLTSVYL